MSNEESLDISKGIEHNKLVYVLQNKALGRIIVTPSIPKHLLPYLEFIDKKRDNP